MAKSDLLKTAINRGWDIPPALKKLALKRVKETLKNQPNDRAVGIATRNLISMNAQNIDLDKNSEPIQQQITVKFEDANPPQTIPLPGDDTPSLEDG